MRLSIALCTYNGERFLREQLGGFATQERLPDELVVCDDRSTDRTPAMLEEFAQATADVCWHSDPVRFSTTGNGGLETLATVSLLPRVFFNSWLPGSSTHHAVPGAGGLFFANAKKQTSIYTIAGVTLVAAVLLSNLIGNSRNSMGVDALLGYLQIKQRYQTWPAAYLWVISYISTPFSNMCWIVRVFTYKHPTLSFCTPLYQEPWLIDWRRPTVAWVARRLSMAYIHRWRSTISTFGTSASLELITFGV